MHTPMILECSSAGVDARGELGRYLGDTLRDAPHDPQRMLPLWRAFTCGEPLERQALTSSTGEDFVVAARAAGLLTAVDVGEAEPWLRSTCCIVPVALNGQLVWVASDFPWYDSEAEAVAGPGAATATLGALVPPRTYRRILDLGSGSGALGVAFAEDGSDLSAVDVNPRAVGFTQLTAALNTIEVDATVGDLRTANGGPYDLIVCNPPFVLGRPSERTVFRDAEDPAAYSGLAHRLPAMLSTGGIGVYLTNWVYGPEVPDPLASLAADLRTAEHSDILVIERALVTVADYIDVWTDDDDLARRWAAGFARDGVTHVGTGAVVVRRAAKTHVDIARPYDVPQRDLAALIDQWLDARSSAGEQ